MEQPRARVLVVDDEPKLGSVVARTLTPEHEVIVLTSAQEALDRIAGGEVFDLILCDLAMPQMDGVEFYECVRSAVPDLLDRIVIITGGAYTVRTLAFLDCPRLCRLEKPFEPIRLRALVREQLRRLGRAATPEAS